MAMTRLDSDERRKAIVRAAVPLFARKGFAGTTTRELAEAAGISEALLFRHFPSKQLLYREILQLGCEGDPALEKLATPAALDSDAGLHGALHGARFLQGGEAERAELDPRLRLMLHSFLEDGDYARELFETVSPQGGPAVRGIARGGDAAGDRDCRAVAPANRFWFAQHVAAMMAFAVPARSELHSLPRACSTTSSARRAPSSCAASA